MPLKPGDKSEYEIALYDGRSRQEWFLKLDGGLTASSISFLSDDSQNLYIRNEGKRIGDFDEQRDWKGGRGKEFFSDNKDGYFDGYNIWTLSSGHVTPTLQWKKATGHRNRNLTSPGNVSWQGLTGSSRYVSTPFTANANYSADKVWIWIRRVGTPGTLTVELCSDSAGNPDTVLKTSTVTTSTITDVISVHYAFDWATTQALTSTTVYHVKIYGASTDNLLNHWEIGVNRSGSDSRISSAGSSWAASTFSMYHDVVDADTAQRFFFYSDGTTFYAVSKKDSGNSQVFSLTGGAATEITGHGLGTVSGRPAIMNGVHFYPQGESTTIRRWNGSSWRGESSNKATFLAAGFDAALGPVMWKANTTTGASGQSDVNFAKLLTAGGSPITYTADATNMLTFQTKAIPVGETTSPITNAYFWLNNGLYVFKSDSVWNVVNGKPVYLDFGLKNTPDVRNGQTALGFQQFLFFNWLFSWERLYSGQLDDVGQGWRGPSLPSGREGAYAGSCAYVGFTFLARDAGTSGTSGVDCFDGVGWHEIFRAPAAGMRVRDVAVQPVSGGRSVLWVDCGGDLFYMTLPLDKARPLDDPSVTYMHEGVLESPTIDMGTASKLPKLIKELTATTANLNGGGIRIECEYQKDDDIGTSSWVPVQPFLLSPEDSSQINAANIRQFRYRLRLMTDTATTPPDLKGVVPTGLARGRRRQVFTMRCTAEVRRGAHKSNPDELMRWAAETSEFPGMIRLTSIFPRMNDYYVELSLEGEQPLTSGKSVFNLVLITI